MDTIQSKTCTKCGADKPLSRFRVDARNTNGRSSWCIDCRNKVYSETYAARRAQTPDGTKKKCNSCGETMDVIFFSNGSCPLGRKGVCVTCLSAKTARKREKYTPEQKAKIADATARWKARNSEKLAMSRRTAWSGFSQNEFDAAMAVQENCCAICHTEFSQLPSKHIHADHDHRNGERRGVLCSKCNTALGLFNDSTLMLRRAAEYLENPPLRGAL